MKFIVSLAGLFALGLSAQEPLLTFDEARRVPHYGSAYTAALWQWDFAPDARPIVVYNPDGSVATGLAEPNGEGNLGVLQAWTLQPNAAGVIVGVIDGPSGFHGSFVSSCLASPLDGVGAVGVAPGVTVLQRTYGGDTVTAARIGELVQAGATVINMSFGWSGRIYPSLTVAAMRDNPDVIFVVAGANSNWDIDAPGIYDALCQTGLPNVVCVASSTKADTRMNPAIWGQNVFGYAPGRRVVVEDYPWVPADAPFLSQGDEEFPELRAVFYESGSSFASPKVAGIVALLWAHYPEETTPQIVERLAAGCEQVAGLAGLSRHGRFNAYRSLLWARSPRLSIDRVNVYVSAGAGQSITVEKSTDLVNWVPVGAFVGTGWPEIVQPVGGGNYFFRVVQ